MPSLPTSDIDSVAPPAVKSLRSKFEQLALDTSPKPSTDFLLPYPTSPRPRALSNPDDQQAPSGSTQHVRNASSSSDLKGKKPPPPPPPSRSKKPYFASPYSSPLLRPVPLPPTSGYASDVPSTTRSSVKELAARPPPPIPSLLLDGRTEVRIETGDDVPASDTSERSLLLDEDAEVPHANGGAPHKSATTPTRPKPSLLDEDADEPKANGVASLRSKFATAPPPPTSPRRPLAPVPATHRITSQPILTTSPPPIISPRPSSKPAPPPRAYRRSFPPAQTPTSPPLVQSPFSDDESDTETVDGSRLPTHQDSMSSIDSFEGPPSSSSSKMSSESDIGSAHSGSFPQPPHHPPVAHASHPRVYHPHPPPRHRATAGSTSESNIASPLATTGHMAQLPPPLPSRRGTGVPEENTPRAGVRHLSMMEDTHVGSASAPPNMDRKAPVTQRLPPPPTRTIALGDKLPPARRLPSDESEESGEEEDPKGRVADSMPDSSRASRRPPKLACHEYSEAGIHVPAHIGVVCAAGHIFVVASHHHVKIYDLSISEAPLWNLDAKALGFSKEIKVTTVEFRCARTEADRARYVWLGTKEGHLVELDLTRGTVVGTKQSVHTSAVTHILRYGTAMVTIDDIGKALVFAWPADADDLYLAHISPRVLRISDKQEFAQIFGGMLWTSAREAPGPPGSGTRGPVIRIYDVLTPGSVGRSVLPLEHLGAVTAGTIVPAHPEHVYLGHEGGFVSIWKFATTERIPECVEVVKVSNSDVLSLEGVNERLWAGGRKGMIAAYDVGSRPWVVTNQWNAHAGLPLQKIFVDPFSIERLGKLCVLSVGRDERVKLWDGLLGADWIDSELLKREHSFSTFRDLKVLLVSWNVDAAKPDALVGSPNNISFLSDVLQSVDSPDIISFGFQELIDLESRKMAAKTVLLGGKKKGNDGSISEKVSSSYKRWYDKLILAVRLAMPPDAPYTVIHTENLVGLFTCIFVKNAERVSLRDVAIATVKRGMGGRYGNKGGIVARLVVDDSSVCFINCHLAAGQRHVRQRNADVAAMLEEKAVFPESEALEESLAYVGGGDGSMVLDHEIVFMNGDMNYRIDQRRDAVVNCVKGNEYHTLIANDQLMKEMKSNAGFRLRSFMEGPLTFPPTYKYDRRSTEYDTSEKRRIPAWCDRVLWRARDPQRVEQLHYKRYEADVSDHRPISAGFRMTVKSVRHDVRAAVKAEVRETWVVHERELLELVRAFYVNQLLI